MRSFEHLADMQALVGQEVGVSDWITVDQNRIDLFAQATGDHQWIHVDAERAAKGPYGTTIAHGFLTLSMVATMAMEVGIMPADARAGLNYGMDKLRFMSPVKAGSRVRNHIKLLAAESRDDGWVLLRCENTVEIEGQDKPALVAVTLGLFSWS